MSLPSARQSVTTADDQGNTQFTRPWFLFLQSVNDSLPANDKPIVITVGASPFAYMAPTTGTLVINGGTVSLINYTRSGVNVTMTGGVIPISSGDTVTVTYSVVPSMTFIRR